MNQPTTRLHVLTVRLYQSLVQTKMVCYLTGVMSVINPSLMIQSYHLIHGMDHVINNRDILRDVFFLEANPRKVIKLLIMKALLLVGAFVASFFGLFAVINLFVILIFPVSWYDVVTCAPWVAVYLFVGAFCAGAVVTEIEDNLL